MSRGQRILEMTLKSHRNKESDEDTEAGTSPVRSIPDELWRYIDSDDSDEDKNYIPSSYDGSSSDEENHMCKKAKRKNLACSYEPNVPAITALQGDANISSSPEVHNSQENAAVPIEQCEENSELPSVMDAERENSFEEDSLQNRKKTRKRGLKGETRKKRSERKLLRNTGKEYAMKSGKLKPARKSEPLGPCRNLCKNIISDKTRLDLFQEYWEMNSFDRRVSYISSLLEFEEKKRRRVRNEGNTERFRQVNVKYHVQVAGQWKRLCKVCFMKVFGENTRFLETVIQKKRASNSGIPQLDCRGSNSKSNPCIIEGKVKIQEFLSQIPAYESHYTRRDCSKLFVAPHLTISALYNEYAKEFCKDSTPLSYRTFCDEFHKKKLAIKKPQIDTCATCDRIALELKLSSEENKEALQMKLDEHHNLADFAYKCKAKDKEASKTEKNKKTITFDLQQCLPTPLLQNSIAFYKRTLWTFNLTVYDCDDGQTYNYLWHEAMAGRGGNEVGSCLYQYLTDLNPEVKSLTMYSDSCPGQNKNSHVAVMCMVALQHSSSLEVIDHKFLLPGHTHMECDSSHSLIEKKKKRYSAAIEHPHDWAQLIRMTGTKKPFIVKEMEQQYFFNFALLLKHELQMRKVDEDGNQFNWKNVKWLRYKKSNSGVIFYKNSLAEEESFKSVNFKRRGKFGNLAPRPLHEGLIPISKEKKSDLLDLLNFISPVFHPFYQNLKTTSDAKNVYPHSDSDSE